MAKQLIKSSPLSHSYVAVTTFNINVPKPAKGINDRIYKNCKFIGGAFLVLLLLSISSCTNNKTFQISTTESIKAEPYGLANTDVVKNDTVMYEISAGNVFWACIFSETIVAPVYFVGWDLYQPVKLKTTKEFYKL